MAKRRPVMAPDELSEELKKSTGQGLGALFPTAAAETEAETEASPPDPASQQENQPASLPATKPTDQHPGLPESKQALEQESALASNITILQFDKIEIDQLREPAYKAQTFRLTEQEIEWIRDVAYQLSKEFRRGKVSQTDLLRIALKLLEHALATNKAEIMTILHTIK